ncbi:Uncharacterized SPBc2 prophage-derived protein yoqJ, partial [Paenibacillus polymyxa]|uniref:Uncharacterized SPBc2 prophage-derived protein yoqJ n=1 Tax=Paenibacillus polymyxa TaxID=1406 RepID=UPI0001E6D1FF
MKAKYPHIENVLAVPFLNQPKAWGDELLQATYWYKKMMEYADVIIDVARHPIYGTLEDHVPLDDYSKTKMFKRNEFMVDQSCYLLAFFDGSSRGTGQCVRYAQRGIINRPSIIKLDPRFACKPEYI